MHLGLGDAEIGHTWMWRLNPHHGSVMEEYVDSVRLRLGCARPCEPVPCAACQNGSLHTGAAHVTCCAVGEAMRGYDAVTTLVHAAAQSCDCTAEMEVPGVILTCGLRMFSPLPWAALYISICSPHAQQAGFDCTQTGHVAKRAYYGPHPPPSEHFLHPDRVELGDLIETR